MFDLGTSTHAHPTVRPHDTGTPPGSGQDPPRNNLALKVYPRTPGTELHCQTPGTPERGREGPGPGPCSRSGFAVPSVVFPAPLAKPAAHPSGPRHTPCLSPLENPLGLSGPSPSLTLPSPGRTLLSRPLGSKEESCPPEVTESTCDPRGCIRQRRERITAPVL